MSRDGGTEFIYDGWGGNSLEGWDDIEGDSGLAGDGGSEI